jgi:hypothetical protein
LSCDVQSSTVADQVGKRAERVPSRLNRIKLCGRKTRPKDVQVRRP